MSQLEPPSGTDSIQHIAFLFQPEDCPTSIGVIRDLNRVTDSGQATVRGYLVKKVSDRELSALINRHGITFELRNDMQEEAKRAMYQLGYRQTPLIITASASGQIRYVLHSRGFDALGRLAELVAPEVAAE